MGDRTLFANALKFPATLISKSDPNTLDDYKEGSWTPSLTFATPGDLSVAYSTRQGYYTKIGNLVTVWWKVATSTFTHTTASGVLKMTGLPYTSSNDSNGFYLGNTTWQGVTKASYTQVNPYVAPNDAALYFAMSGSGQAYYEILVADVPTGTVKVFYGSAQYKAA